MKQLKYKPCKVCKTQFKPFSSLSRVCSPHCALKLVRSDKEKALKKDTRERKKKLKTKTDYANEAQTACNAYIRERDKNLGCISCGTTKPVQYCAGHYKTRGGHPELRFHPFNLNKQCNQYCNLQLSGNISNYRPELIKKIGISQVQWLESKHEIQNLTIEDLIEIRQYYKEQLKLLKVGVITI